MFTPHELTGPAAEPEHQDTRWVYSTRCTFWGPIQTVGKMPGPIPLPCCPHCFAPLFEMPSKAKWDQGAVAYAAAKNDPRYPAFLEWVAEQTKLKGCMVLTTNKHLAEIRALFDQENPA